MADAVRVQVVEGVEGLAHHKGRLRLRQVLTLRDEEEKFTTFTKSEENKKIWKVREDQARRVAEKSEKTSQKKLRTQ